MRRRQFIVLVGRSAVAWPLRAQAQQASRIYRLGFLSAGFSDNPVVRSIQSIAAELARFGFTEGKNLLIEARYAEGRAECLPELAKEIAATHADVILAVSTPAAHAAKDAAPSTRDGAELPPSRRRSDCQRSASGAKWPHRVVC